VPAEATPGVAAQAVGGPPAGLAEAATVAAAPDAPPPVMKEGDGASYSVSSEKS